ncbi:MAG: B12-binding domain-containing radical SAM protein [Candidatus Micrarchaeia archaeon]
MAQRILLVNPQGGVNTDLPNMGLAYAATHYNSKVIDFNTKPLPHERLFEEQADILGISVRSFALSDAKKIAGEYKKKFPNAQVKSVSGFLDVQCCYPFLNFKETLSYDENFSDNYPFPNFEFFDSFDEFKKNWESGKWAFPVMTSKGCPFQCTYCTARNRKWFPRSAQNCVEELRRAKEKWKIKKFQVLDDCFNLDNKRVLDFCEKVAPLELEWYCTNGVRADRFNKQQALAMSKSGCDHVGFGIESVDPNVLQKIRKGESFEQIEKAVDIANKHFWSVTGFFIIGLPGSSFDGDMAAVNFCNEKGIAGNFSFYVPFDKQVQSDKKFYGDGSQPVSDAYSLEEQQRVYDEARKKNLFKIFNLMARRIRVKASRVFKN